MCNFNSYQTLPYRTNATQPANQPANNNTQYNAVDVNNVNMSSGDSKLVCEGMTMVGQLPSLSFGSTSATEDSSSSSSASNNLTAITAPTSSSSEYSSLFNMDVILPSIPLAFLIMIEHMINVNLYAGLVPKHPTVDNNDELVALGLTNVLSSLFSSFGTGAGFSRSSLNYKSGAKSQMSSFLSSILTLLMILTLSQIIQFLPRLGTYNE